MTKDAEFPSPFKFHGFEPITLVELRMRFYSGTIRSKPKWWEKVDDTAIVANWRREIVNNDCEEVERLWGGDERFREGDTPKQWPRDAITEAQLDYIFEELKHEAAKRDPQNGIFESGVRGVHESGILIPPSLKERLVSATSVLEGIPDEAKDWHPGSNRQVLDLVHPSLYCARIGKTRIRTSDTTRGHDSLEVLTNETYAARRPDLMDEYDLHVSTKYQWLPTDFTISATGEVVAVDYINNLHPMRHRALYSCITDILARFVPLFERVLGHAIMPHRPLAINTGPGDWYQGLGAEEPECPSDMSDGEFEGPSAAPDVVPFPLQGRTIQVIVKLANIVLTPEHPCYAGGTWHVEGMANERIVATGIYYYASENITESRLTFRTTIGQGNYGEGLPYENGDCRSYSVVYGFSKDDALNQKLGHVIAAEDKCVAFPNICQHRVAPFELADPSKPGHRKILCFFLVDPTIKILSTSDVPPQQAEWALDEAAKAPAMKNLPQELFDMVEGYVVGDSRREAEEDREALMEERSNFVVLLNEDVFEMEFAMCEH